MRKLVRNSLVGGMGAAVVISSGLAVAAFKRQYAEPPALQESALPSSTPDPVVIPMDEPKITPTPTIVPSHQTSAEQKPTKEPNVTARMMPAEEAQAIRTEEMTQAEFTDYMRSRMIEAMDAHMDFEPLTKVTITHDQRDRLFRGYCPLSTLEDGTIMELMACRFSAEILRLAYLGGIEKDGKVLIVTDGYWGRPEAL